jgi:hypothetical protein
MTAVLCARAVSETTTFWKLRAVGFVTRTRFPTPFLAAGRPVAQVHPSGGSSAAAGVPVHPRWGVVVRSALLCWQYRSG